MDHNIQHISFTCREVINALGIVALKFQNLLNQTNSGVSRLMGLKLCCSKMGA
jgi:hypothetical protein